MKEKIWMEKLIELLNEYEIEKEKSEWVNVDAYVEFRWDYNHNRLVRYDETDHWEWDNLYWDTAVAYLISKSFWFIKWLVENDKIERPEIRSQGYTKPTYWYTTEPYTTCKSIELANTILMILAIKDEPINFLISILK